MTRMVSTGEVIGTLTTHHERIDMKIVILRGIIENPKISLLVVFPY
jgi:hypothetical protein